MFRKILHNGSAPPKHMRRLAAMLGPGGSSSDARRYPNSSQPQRQRRTSSQKMASKEFEQLQKRHIKRKDPHHRNTEMMTEGEGDVESWARAQEDAVMESHARQQARRPAWLKEYEHAARNRRNASFAMEEENDERLQSSSSLVTHPAVRRGSAVGYEERDPTTGEGLIQQWFNQLLLRSIVHFWCPDRQRPNRHNTELETSLRTTELLALIRQEMPTFSFAEHCDGVPFSLLIRNCLYLQGSGGYVHFQPIYQQQQQQSLRSDDNTDDHFKSSGRKSRELFAERDDDEVEEESTRRVEGIVIGLKRYKHQEALSWDGVRQGPQPWRFSGSMMPHDDSRR